MEVCDICGLNDPDLVCGEKNHDCKMEICYECYEDDDNLSIIMEHEWRTKFG